MGGGFRIRDWRTHGLGYKLKFLFEAIGHVVLRRTFFLESSPRPAMFLEWFVIAATVVAIRRREWRLVCKSPCSC